MSKELKPKILTVDDRIENLYVLDRILSQLDIEVIKTTSSVEALALTLEHEFFAAIVDVQMPEMDGYELVELLRGNESTASLPILFVSAIYSDEYHHRRAYDAGAVDFLSKPFIPEILISKVNVFLDLYRQRQQLETLVSQLNTLNAELEDRVQARTAELEKAYHQLELLDRNKSEFIQIISHELRTPLTLIKGFSQMLSQRGQFSEDAPEKTWTMGIANGAERMHEIVNSMLDMARIDSASLEFMPEWLSIHDVFLILEDALSRSLATRELQFVVGEQLVELPRIYADREALTKVCNQLLLNAIKYTPDGGCITANGCFIPASAGDDGLDQDFVQIVVSDTGIGIDPQVQELIFTKFYQTGPVSLHSSGKTKFKGGGAGLGLAIARGIIESHGGTIWAESEGYDEQACPGSQFHILLPVKMGQVSQSSLSECIENLRNHKITSCLGI